MKLGKVNKLTHNIDISSLSSSFDLSSASRYLLVGTINTARSKSVRSTHFTAVLFDHVLQKAIEFDDKKVKKYQLDKKLNDETFQKSVYIAFYVRQDCIKSLDICDVYLQSVNEPWKFSIKSQIDIENYYFGLSPLSQISIEKHDLFTTLDSLLNRDIVSQFIFNICHDKPNILSASSRLLTSVADGFYSQEYEHFVTKCDALNKQLILIPYHQSGRVGHWSLVLVYPNIKTVFHCDSKRNNDSSIFDCILHLLQKCHIGNQLMKFKTWTLLKPEEIPQQTDGFSCGPLTCLNAFNFVNATSYRCLDEEMIQLSYWITSVVINSYKEIPKYTGNKKRNTITDKPKKGKRKVENVVKDYSETRYSCIYEKIRIYPNNSTERFEDKHMSETSNEEDDCNEHSDFDDDISSAEEAPKLPVLEKDLRNFLSLEGLKEKTNIHFTEIYRQSTNNKRVPDMIYAYIHLDKGDFQYTFDKAMKKVKWNDKKHQSVTNELLKMYTGDNVPFQIRTSRGRFFDTVVFAEVMKLFISTTEKTNLFDATHILFNGYPFNNYILLNSEEDLPLSIECGRYTIQVVHGDILKEVTHAIVNPANELLENGGGVTNLFKID